MTSELDRGHRLADRLRALLQRRALVARELDLDNLLETVATKLAWDAEEEVLHTVLALQPRGTRQNAPLVIHDGLGHLDCARRRCVVRRAGLEVFHDLGTAV